MRRKLYQTLLEWKNNENGRVALMIEGARRTGKSWLAEHFARQEYLSYILVDFSIISPELKSVFDNYLHDVDTFLMYLQAVTGVKLYTRQSVIIFDEVQFYPKARQAIKHLVADGRFDYIETGSLVSIKKNTRGDVWSSIRWILRNSCGRWAMKPPCHSSESVSARAFRWGRCTEKQWLCSDAI
jgi:predicted AAA+ superfamily ATPase